MTTLEIWTDGACKGNPGPGGWGVLMIYGAHEAIRRPCPVRLHLDSSYVRDGITGWIYGWKKKGWKTAGGSPVKNVELWQKLDQLVTDYKAKAQIEWVWVKGHAGDPGNERADELANEGVLKAQTGQQ